MINFKPKTFDKIQIPAPLNVKYEGCMVYPLGNVTIGDTLEALIANEK